jgi:hypothetical protein
VTEKPIFHLTVTEHVRGSHDNAHQERALIAGWLMQAARAIGAGGSVDNPNEHGDLVHDGKIVGGWQFGDRSTVLTERKAGNGPGTWAALSDEEKEARGYPAPPVRRK